MYYEQRVPLYKAVIYNAYNKAPKDYLTINFCATLAKASNYYTKLNNSLTYYAATILYLYYKTYCEIV
jgi:hypothetical protein